jgi:hypothetical protein
MLLFDMIDYALHELNLFSSQSNTAAMIISNGILVFRRLRYHGTAIAIAPT